METSFTTNNHLRKRGQRALNLLVALALLLLTLGASAPLQPAAVNVQPQLLQLAAEEPGLVVRVIVQKSAPGEVAEQALTALGGRVIRDLGMIQAFAAEVAAGQVVPLAQTAGVKWISLDAPMAESALEPAGGFTLRENFDNDEADGWPVDPAWSGQAWTEIGENDGAKSGDVAVTDFLGGLRTGLRIQNGGKGLWGSADLSGAASATLSLGYRRKGLDSPEDYVTVEVSADGGASWTELDRLAGPATDSDVQAASYDISGFASSVTAVRFLSSLDLGETEKVYFDFVQIAVSPISNDLFSAGLSIFGKSADLQGETLTVTGGDGSSTAVNLSTGEPWIYNWMPFSTAGIPMVVNEVIVAEGCPGGGTCLEVNSAVNASLLHAEDLSGAVSATLSFTYRQLDSGAAALEVSTTNGATWTTLKTYSSQVSGRDQFDLTPYRSASTLIRFKAVSPSAVNLLVDDVNIAISTAAVPAVVGPTSSLADTFSTVSYSANAGSQQWASAWTETGDGTGSPSLDYIRISSGALQLKAPNRTLTRAADLGGATTATLSFKYRRSGLDNSSDYVAVLVSADSGASWKELARFAGSGSDSAYKAVSYNISAYAVSNTLVRFATSSLLGTSDIVYIDDVKIEHRCDTCIDTARLDSIYVDATGAVRLWNGSGHLQGQGIGVAVIDSGVALHEDLRAGETASRVVCQVRFDTILSDFDDQNGHGSHVSGVIAGNGAQSDGTYMGVAPRANLVDVKVTDDLGMSYMSDVVGGLQWVLENKTAYNIRVVNLSLNSTVNESYHTSPLNAAVEILWFNSIVVVVSAGNNGTAELFPPANDPFVLVVGAVDDMGTWEIGDDTVATFSAYGTTLDGFAKPDLVAPGRNIISLLASDDSNFALGHPANIVPGAYGLDYFRMSGTSAAAPVVSGAVALLLQDEPNLTPDQVKYRLMATANRTWSGYNPTTAGAGYVDIYAAVNGTGSESANTGVTASQLLTTGTDPVTGTSVGWNSVGWNSVGWNSVGWNSVGWNSVGWNSVGWNSVGWNSDYWEE